MFCLLVCLLGMIISDSYLGLKCQRSRALEKVCQTKTYIPLTWPHRTYSLVSAERDTLVFVAFTYVPTSSK